MQQNVNDIFDKITSLGYQVLASSKLRKQGSKQPIEPSKLYKENLNIFNNLSLEEFENTIKQRANLLLVDKIENGSPMSNLLNECNFIYEKFRWFVTQNRTKIFFEKTRFDAEEYSMLTTEKDSEKFFNAMNDIELIQINKLVLKHNAVESNKDNLLTEEKLVKLVIEDLRKNPNYRLHTEPVTLSNHPNEPCFKFFNLKEIKEYGEAYTKTHGVRPPTPAWDQFFARVRDQTLVPIIKAFFTGIFYAKNRTKQCLYLWGAGNDGKSQITEALAKAMGDNVTFVFDQYLRSNQFSSYDAFGKRLALGEEMEAPNVIKNKTVHAITGQSRVRIEAKGEQAFHTRLYSCCVITSNVKPLIEDVKNQTTRLIYVEIDSANENDINESGTSWGKALQDEFNNMIFEGIKYYKKFNPDGGSFRLPEDYNDTLVNLHDDETIYIEEFISRCFVANEDAVIRDRLGHGFVEFVTINYFPDKNVPKEYMNNQISRKIFEKLKNKFPKIERSRKKSDGVQYRTITGISIATNCGGLLPIFEV